MYKPFIGFPSNLESIDPILEPMVQLAWAIALSHYTNSDDVLYGLGTNIASDLPNYPFRYIYLDM